MKLVKAKLKSQEELAQIPRVVHCQEYFKGIISDPDYQGVITLDLDDSSTDHIHCTYCDHCFGDLTGYLLVGPNALVPIDLFDIDEGLPN